MTVLVYTRIGGANREYHKDEINKLKQHKQYVCNYDDHHDETYAYFKFNVLPEYVDTAKKVFKEDPVSVWDKFQNHIKKAADPNSDTCTTGHCGQGRQRYHRQGRPGW